MALYDELHATRSLHPSARSLPGYHPGGRVEGAGGMAEKSKDSVQSSSLDRESGKIHGVFR